VKTADEEDLAGGAAGDEAGNLRDEGEGEEV